MIWLLACQAELADPLPDARTGVELHLDEKRVASGEPLVLTATVTAPPDWEVSGSVPAAEGLTVDLLDEQSADQGDLVVVTKVFSLTGADGSYVLPGGTWTFNDPNGNALDVPAGTLFADIGVDGPSSDLAGLAAMPVREAPPYELYAAAAAAAVLALAGLVWWRRREQPEPPPPPPVPPDLEALKAWHAVRHDPELDDHGRALALSALFRRYLERRTGIAATKLTSFEILERPEIPPECRRSVKQLLSATDLIKFAREGGGPALFDELDGELRLVIKLTSPVQVAE